MTEGIIEFSDVRNVSKKDISEHTKNKKNEQVDFSCWEKLDLRVAQIKKVEDIAGADKLYKITIDVGEIGERVICAGIKQYYDKKELKGKKIIYFSNLKPRMMKGIESQGMLLAASTEGHEKVVLITPKENVNLGEEISFENG
jgi:methionyl-tRNA synthetase